MRRAGLAAFAALDGAIVEGVVDMMSVCAYALLKLKKKRLVARRPESA
jgi:hypothetical protein